MLVGQRKLSIVDNIKADFDGAYGVIAARSRDPHVCF